MSQMLKGFFNAREARDSNGRQSQVPGSLDSDAENAIFHDLDNSPFDFIDNTADVSFSKDSNKVDADFFNKFEDDFDEDDMKKAR